jgi:tRNA U34 2-thiouridine synthase MnmA/TrmU
MFKFQHTEWTIPALIFKYSNNDEIKVWLSISTRAITPGQQAVFYHKDVCLGSAKIMWTAGLSALFGRERMSGQEEQVAL